MGIPLIGFVLSAIAFSILLSSESIRQTSPLKWSLLIAFTIGESITVGFISSLYAYNSVIKAMVACAMATFTITLYSMLQTNPKYDLSQWGRVLGGLGVAFVLYGFIHVLELFGVV